MKQIRQFLEQVKWKNIFDLVLGNAILAFAIQAFIVPHDFITGGATGIALFLKNFLPFPVSSIVGVLNLCFFALGAVILGRHFAATTLLSTLLYPGFLRVLESIPQLQNLTDDLFLCAVLGGLLTGVGVGLALRSGASTGGTDVLPLLGKKFWNIPVARGMAIVDLAVLAGQMFHTTSSAALYGIVAVLLSSLAIDKVMVAGESQIQMMVFSPKYQQIRDCLLEDVGLGVTMLQIETGYQGARGAAILSVMPSRKYPRTKQLVLLMDPEAFIVVGNVSEVNGRGYTIPDLPEPPEPRALNSQPQ